MADTSSQEPVQSSSGPGKIIRLIRKILIGAIIMFCINFILKQTGWDSWKTFSEQADSFAENMMINSARLSPISLWKSIISVQNTYDNTPGRYFSDYPITGKLTFKDKLMNWLGYYWFTKSGKAFWFGRIFLFITVLAGILFAVDDYKKSRDKTIAVVAFPFNFLFKYFVFLLGIGICCLLLYFIIKLFLLIGGGIVFIASAIHATGGFAKLLLDESKSEVVGSSKKKVAAYILPFLIKKKK